MAQAGGVAGASEAVAIDTTLLVVALGGVAAVCGVFVAYAAVWALSLVFGPRRQYR